MQIIDFRLRTEIEISLKLAVQDIIRYISHTTVC